MWTCAGCGSSPTERERFAADADDVRLDLYECRYCGNGKCCMCDMGDDVGCLGCDSEGGE